MFGSTILDVATGVVFGFLAISLFSSAAVEAINSILKLRATNLLSGVQALVNDPDFTGLAKQLYEHASVSPLGPGLPGDDSKKPYADKKNLPSYIDKLQFAGALLDVTGLSAVSAVEAAQKPGPQAVEEFSKKLKEIEIDPQIKQLLQGVVNRTTGDIKEMEKQLANWFDVGMDRLSGTFKRSTLVWTFIIALPIAFVFNMDSIRIGMRLWEQPSLADTLKSPPKPSSAANGVDDAMNSEQLALSEIRMMAESGLPVGWAPGHFFEAIDEKGQWRPLLDRPTTFFWSLVGWIVTAVAALFGAPFWFDTLQMFVRLKGSGPSPAEKANGQAASS